MAHSSGVARHPFGSGLLWSESRGWPGGQMARVGVAWACSLSVLVLSPPLSFKSTNIKSTLLALSNPNHFPKALSLATVIRLGFGV